MKPKTQVYLDHAAATPMRAEVLDAMNEVAPQWYNPSSLYGAAREAKRTLEAARARLAQVLGAKPSEITLTAGGTESVNAAILGVARVFPGSRVVASSIEHEAVTACLKVLESEGHKTDLIPVSKEGIVHPDTVKKLIDDQTVLVSVMLANNEIGTVQPVGKIAEVVHQICADRKERGVTRPLYLHTDAAQAAGYLDLAVARLGVDLLSLNAAKIGGPKGSGLLYVRTGVSLKPLTFGGGHERGRRAGTENVAAAIGFATALELAQAERASESKRIKILCDRLWKSLQQEVGEVTLNGSANKRLPGNLNLTIPGIEGETLVHHLDAAGIQVGTGSACSESDQDPSHVLLGIGLSPALARSSIRVTLGRTTTRAEVDFAATTLPRLVKKLRTLGKTA